jgi:hypothetical protein
MSRKSVPQADKDEMLKRVESVKHQNSKPSLKPKTIKTVKLYFKIASI